LIAKTKPVLAEAAMSERDLFIAALQIPEPAERSAWLDRECGGDAALRQRIDVLLQAFDKAGSLLENPAVAVGATSDEPITEAPGAVVGPYKLLEQIGEGGFGVVFLAEQAEPVRRKVALKVLKPGMDTRQVVARFEAERQALAILDHPHIAKVFDGGATPSGRPYFVMELVKGVPITEFCDLNHLTPRQRLELFVAVCEAVQHAHQKGIIHRDLKPSNVLVSRHDTTPMVKVIDFGVAKTLGQVLTDKTLFTGIAQLIGTPLYMSPEQAGQSGLDIDTRSDIYSLGVLLYELLTGTTPFDEKRFRQAAYEEIRRIIREEDPPRPSTRLSESKDSLPSISAQRNTEPAKLTRLVRGELDWIVMKCLEKDRNRRYETANGLTRDIEHYLHDEPVAAGPPSAWYRARKFGRKHRAAIVSTGAFVVLLVVATAVSAGLAWWANKERLRAVAAEKSAETRLGQVKKSNEILASVFRDLDPRVAEKEGKDLRVALGERLDLAAGQLEGESVGDPLVVAELQNTLGRIQGHLGYTDRAITLLQKAVATCESKLSPDHHDTLASRSNLASAYLGAGRIDEAIALFESTLKPTQSQLGPDDPHTLNNRNNLAEAYLAAGRTGEAIEMHEATLKVKESKLGPDHPETLVSRHNLASAYLTAGRTAEAITLLETTLKMQESKLGPDHPDTLTNRNNLTAAYREAGRSAEAITLHEATLKLQESKLGPDHPDTLVSRHNLAAAFHSAGRTGEAIALHEATLKLRESKLGRDHPDTLQSRHNLAVAFHSAGRTGEAIEMHEATLKRGFPRAGN
jgi:serine/threonine protein kinase/tetratricopeptide (TPR) repeat protein